MITLKTGRQESLAYMDYRAWTGLTPDIEYAYDFGSMERAEEEAKDLQAHFDEENAKWSDVEDRKAFYIYCNAYESGGKFVLWISNGFIVDNETTEYKDDGPGYVHKDQPRGSDVLVFDNMGVRAVPIEKELAA